MAHTWFPRVSTLAIWALAAWSAAFWALRIAGSSPAAAAPAPLASTAPTSDLGNTARVFGPAIEKRADGGVAAPAIDPSTRFTLAGVVANRVSAGIALLAVDGKPARPYRVGSIVDDGFMLKSVTVRSATLAVPRTGATLTVNLAAANAAPAMPAAPAAAFPLPRVRPAVSASAAEPSS